VPLVCLPNPAADQPALAARVAALGAGVAPDGEGARPEAIAGAVDRVLADRAYADVAGRLAEAIALLPGGPMAASQLERLAADPITIG
jgi:UDP:flavonoid glycosyltransferase YjiC (YdhE family)